MSVRNKSKFETEPLMLLLSKRESVSDFLDLDTSIYGKWEALVNLEKLSAAQRKEKEMLSQLIEWFKVASELERQKESEK